MNIRTLYVVNTGQILFKHNSVLVCSCCTSKGTRKMSSKHPSSTWQRHRTLCGVTNILLSLPWNFFSSFTVKSSCTEVTMISIDLRPILWWTFHKLYALNIHQTLIWIFIKYYDLNIHQTLWFEYSSNSMIWIFIKFSRSFGAQLCPSLCSITRQLKKEK